jgi:hypothetical protein
MFIIDCRYQEKEPPILEDGIVRPINNPLFNNKLRVRKLLKKRLENEEKLENLGFIEKPKYEEL